jgi:hypothetical protein
MKEFAAPIILKLDLIGFSASSLCALHCAAIPFILTYIPLIGFEFFSNHLVEFLMIGLSLLIGSISFINGYKFHHRRLKPFIIFLTGFALILAGHFLMPVSWEYVFAPAGALVIAVSHLTNRKLCKSCRLCND